MAGLRGARAGETVRREAHGDPPQRMGGSGKGAEGRSPPQGAKARGLSGCRPGLSALSGGGEILCPGALSLVTVWEAGGIAPCASSRLPGSSAHPGLLCPSLSPLCLSVTSLHLLRARGVPGLLRVLF